jgi:glycerophosphoryl diester phosphodiesterase
MALEVPAQFHGMPFVTEKFVEHAHKHGIKVYAWTVNDPAEMRKLFEMGVDGIFSDDPATALKEAAAFRQKSAIKPSPPAGPKL